MLIYPISPPPSPMATTNLFSLCMNLFLFCLFIHLFCFLVFTHKWTHLVFVFFVWLISFIIPSRSIHVVTMTGIHSFVWLRNIPLHIYHILFFHSSINGDLGCFHLDYYNKAAINTEAQILSQITDFVFLWWIPRSGITWCIIFLFSFGKISA